jgi:hypothetical protein
MLENEIYGERNMRTSLIALLAAVLVPFALTSPAAAAPGVSLGDAVVVDGARSIAYVMHPQGGVEALDLQRGSSLWRSTEAERPLALAGDLLVAQGRPGEHGELRIVALDVLHNGAGSAEADLPMPAGVRAEASETLRQAFHVTASASQQGVVVAWRAQLRRAFAGRGAGEIDAERKTAGEAGESRLQGSALFDPHAGSLLPLEAADAERISGPRSVAAASLSSPSGVSAGASERRFASADGRHVLASRATDSRTSQDHYLWTISDAATGTVLGTMPSSVSMTPFVVVGTRLLQVVQPVTRRVGGKTTDTPLRLRAVDLATGRELWMREVRDTAFLGPFPL